MTEDGRPTTDANHEVELLRIELRVLNFELKDSR